MRRKTIFLTIGVAVLLIVGIGTGLAVLVEQEPQFYRDRAVAPGQTRRQQSSSFVGKFATLLSELGNEQKVWHASFTEAEINSYFDEHFIESGVAEKLLPEGIAAPRLALDADTIHLAFRYGCPPWSTIISIDLRVWLAAKAELNVVALELQGLHAGSLPISAQSLLEQISEVARKRNIEVTWYRHNGNPVALLRFLSERPRPTVQLQRLHVTDGALTISGISEQQPVISGGTMPGLVPNAN